MVRLFAVKTSIVTLKRALSLSSRLKPATWEFLSLFCASLFVLSAWGLRDSQHAYVSLDESRGSSNIEGQVVDFDRRGYATSHGHAAIVLRADRFQRMSNKRYQIGGSPSLTLTLPRGGISQHHRHISFYGITEFVRRPAIDLQQLWRAFRPPLTIIYQVAQERDSLGKELMPWFQIFGVISVAFLAFMAQILALIGLHRKRLEGTLLRLEIEKRRLEIEQLKIILEQARSETG